MPFKYLIAILLACIGSVANAQYRYGALAASQLPQDRVIKNVSDLRILSDQSTNIFLQSDQLLGPVPPSNALIGRTSAWVWIFYMYEYSTGAIIPNATMVLGPLHQRPNSGGHDHDSPARPKGFLSAHTGFTGSTGLQFQSVYTAPEVSGHVQSSISCTAPGYPSCDPGDFFVFATAVPNLVSLPQSNSYSLIGSTPEHTSNHFATSSFATKLAALADMYFIKYGELPNPKLSFNDISLESGGLFDIAATGFHRTENTESASPLTCEHRRRQGLRL